MSGNLTLSKRTLSLQGNPLNITFALIVLWTFVSFLCLLTFHRIRIDVELPSWAWASVAVATLCATIFESALVLLSIALVKRYLVLFSQHSHLSWFVRGVSISFTTLFLGAIGVALLSIVMSWNFAFHRLNFLTVSVLNSALLDFVTLAPFLSGREIVLIVVASLVGIGLVRLLYVITPELPVRYLLRLAMFTASMGLLVCISVRMIPVFTIAEPVSSRIRTVFESYSLPSMALFWGPIVFYSPMTSAVILDELVPIQSFEQYRTLIDFGKKRKNVLVFAVEALRADELGNVVNGQETLPNLNRLLKKGINFTRAYSTGNESAYAMTSVVSGLLPLKYEHRDRFTSIHYPLQRIYDLLSSVYSTAFISSANENWQNMDSITNSPHLDFFFHAPLFRGASLPIPKADSGLLKALEKGKLATGKLDDGTTAEAVMDWILKLLDKQPEKPFFGFVSFQSSHYPYEQGFDVPRVFSPSELSPEEERSMSFFDYPKALAGRMLNRYRNSIRYSDAQIGRIVNFLEEKGLLKDTIIIAFGDHGELFYENGSVTHASKLYNKSLHVAMLMVGSNKYPVGEYAAPVSLLDVNPLILSATEMPAFNGFQGRVPPGLESIQADKLEQFSPIFSSVQNIAKEDSVLVGRWKYVANPLMTIERLYDVSRDPLELKNLIRVGDHTQIASCLRETLRDFRVRQITYYRSDELRSTFFPPRHRMASLYCDPDNIVDD